MKEKTFICPHCGNEVFLRRTIFTNNFYLWIFPLSEEPISRTDDNVENIIRRILRRFKKV